MDFLTRGLLDLACFAGLLDFWTLGLWEFLTLGLSDFGTLGLFALDFVTFGLWDFGTLGLWVSWTFDSLTLVGLLRFGTF